MTRSFCPPLDPGIASYVTTLADAGVETFESCDGSPGHAYKEPTIRFSGDRAAGFRALAIAQTHGFPVASIRRTWPVVDGEPTGPYWEMTFYRPCIAGLDRAGYNEAARIEVEATGLEPVPGHLARAPREGLSFTPVLERVGRGVRLHGGHPALVQAVPAGPVSGDDFCAAQFCQPGIQSVARVVAARSPAAAREFLENLARRSAQTHCKRGHRFMDENTMVSTRGERICRKCRRAAQWGAARGMGRDEAIALRYPPDADYGRVTVEDVAAKIRELAL